MGWGWGVCYDGMLFLSFFSFQSEASIFFAVFVLNLGMLQDVRKAHAWGCCWTKEMLVWVLGLLEGVCLSNHWTLVLSWKRTLDGPIAFLKIFILLNQIQLFPFHAWGPFMLNLFLNFGWLGPGLRMNFDLSKVEKTVYYHVYGKMSFPAFHRLALRWKGKTNRRKSHVGILCIISN